MKELYEKPKIVDIDEDELVELYAMEGDTARCINFKFKSSTNIIDLTGCKVRINAINSKCNVVFNDLTVLDTKRGIAQLKLTNAMLQPGVTLYQLQITGPAGELKPKIMRLNVDNRLNNDGAIEGTNEFTALQNGLKVLDGYDDRLINIEGKFNQIDENEIDISNLKNTTSTLNNSIETTNNDLNTTNNKVKTNEKNINSLKNTVDKNKKKLNALENVKGIPYSDLVCFIPSKTKRFFQTFELIPEKNEIIAGYRNVNETVENKVAELQKFDYISKESKSHKEVDLLYHINDIAYLPTKNELLIATMDPENPYKLVVLDYDTLNFKRYQEIPNLSNTISGVAYNKDSEKIILKTGGTNNIKILSKDYNIEKEIAVTQEETFQAIASYRNYVYFVMNNILKVINIDTEETIVYRLNGAGENEGCSIDVNGNIWLGYVTPGGDYRYDTPRLFECDLTQKSYHGNMNIRYSYWSQIAKNNMLQCGQYFYIKKESGQWKVSTQDGSLGIYSRAGNNFIELKIVDNHLEIHTRLGLLYKLHGGVHLDRFININKAGLKAGLQCSVTYSTNEGIRVDFVDVASKVDVLPNNVPDNVGFTVNYNLGIQGL